MATNVKILCIEEGIPIRYNGSEENVETIFGFDTSNNLIQRFTFLCDVYPSYELNHKLASAEEVDIETACLFYSFRYQISFAHFCCQTLPKLLDFFELSKTVPELRLLVPKHHYNNFVKDIFACCNIDLSKCVFMEDNHLYNVKSFYKTRTFDCIPDNFSKDHIAIFSLIRSAINVKPCLPRRRVYLRKDGAPNPAFGNSETGVIRKIINEEELIVALKSIGFEIVTLGDKSISEKYELLKDAEYLITQIGANCMNFAFTNAPTNIILLTNDVIFGERWYSNLCSTLNGAEINTTVLYYKSHVYNKDPTNMWNNPFFVDISEVLSNIKTA
jgi:capsular polysaccharide biosynthesis protein